MQADFDLLDFLPYLLNLAAEEASLGFQTLYKTRYGMLRTEWRVLFHLGIYGEMTATEIGERARMHKTKISRAVQKLTAPHEMGELFKVLALGKGLPARLRGFARGDRLHAL